MKILKLSAILVVVLLILYLGAIFLGFNLPKPAFLEKSIAGNAVLSVRLVMDNNAQNPVNRVEVDLGEKPGPPAKGGAAVTDDSGIATFNVKPGNYVIYFNEGTFPQNLQIPELISVQVLEGQINEKTIKVTTK